MDREQQRYSLPANSQMSLSTNLRERREKLGLTQQQVADSAGIMRPVYARLEGGGRANPRADTLRRLAAALRTTVDRLIG